MTETEQAAADQLDRLQGTQELRAGVLALLLPDGSKRAQRAWQIECEASMPRADTVREWVAQLPATARLPWLETLVMRMRGQSLADRQALLEATRRVMSARGIQRPIDRLHWLAMRQWLGEFSAADDRNAVTSDLSQLPQSDVAAIATYSAFLARMVPVEAAELEDTAAPAAGVAWYGSVMNPWRQNAEVPPCTPPDSGGFVHALQELQGVAWMQRPALVRGWVTAATQHSRHGRLTHTAADALRLSCTLLASPMPPALARHYGAPAPGSAP